VPAGSYARLAVSDTGVGMTEAVREKAFEPFFTTKPKGMGTGLGLATTYGIVKENGGHVEIDSEHGSGTTLTVLLPATAGAATALAGTAAAPAASGDGERILIVEDEEGVRRVADRILSGHGYETVCAAGPDEALRVCKQTAVDLVLTDVVMPHMSGAMLVAKLREDVPNLPAIFMSGYTDRPGALPPEARFIGKPFSRHDLLELVARTLGKEGGST
jgi:two-component system cell cycle sensor histidine kinase/response regulator CckA